MRRKTTRSLVHLVVFGCIVFLLIYLNRPPSPNKSFPWTRVRYQSTSKVPETRGICPGLEKSTKPALVVSRVAADGDASWLDALSQRYHLCIYTVDAPADPTSKYLQVPANRGHEAMAYLTFLIDNYEHIPAGGAVFVHGSRFAWHNDHPEYDNAALLAALNVEAALEPAGYHNMRCDWSTSMCLPAAPAQGSLENNFQAVLEPWSARIASDKALPRALATIFGGDEEHEVAKMGRTDTLRAQCCAQFVVSRESVRRHAREEYVALRQWLLDGREAVGRDRMLRDDRVAGRILSYMWHVLFIRQRADDLEHPLTGGGRGVNLDRLNVQACPRADECYCRLYGRCGLSPCRGPGSCLGQYTLPNHLKLPDDWAETHS
ncbi:hypothetical protein CDV56_108639 [Aspergillus terreus]|uniref:Uncharacterized protein n=1 Tax=Aspergillus terreus TaxID=33178 RepID=A0A5M3YP22_ASPTE|nr:hypothetical protein ATETN484_0002039500 [Aspergillus terreus]GFF15251.1 hypothetical protein CDV56_108639 [Aspergillus terreus]